MKTKINILYANNKLNSKSKTRAVKLPSCDDSLVKVFHTKYHHKILSTELGIKLVHANCYWKQLHKESSAVASRWNF